MKFKKYSTLQREFVSDGGLSGFVFHSGLKSDPLCNFELFLATISILVTTKFIRPCLGI